ncbi:unnamed protein product [Didymodactylos carnosus]|uniref:Uncharacterized protein n=1 Tax=Didymodactylos carnosus TaxID=1234261 RepID=A0A814ZC76_9BILA|nr:unnamed protein product [Didymodactylos carnosus]CAF1242135.1 unnamed protein product [Didymodactylos carnosus]CAF3667897.1 unnamed protein product [Didymodactylos carnosus]CAF4005715.1 unnamed protein product [Didymodactylos carnosus]
MARNVERAKRIAQSPRKRGYSGRPAILISEHEQENIRLSDVPDLSLRWIASVDALLATAYLEHTRKVEQTFKESDQFSEQIEEDIVDDHENVASEIEETTDPN